ncbi:hypothetical protein [Pseudidiomarina sp.]|uniref:hypothetical protein n=1 Tax=Pseudidiomarina sp. TaxID=2081707 RepID=UPI003A97E625
MKYQCKVLLTAFLAAGLSVFNHSAEAQETYQETTIEGEIYYAEHPDFQEFTGPLETALTFTVVITEDLDNYNLVEIAGGLATYDTTTAYEFWLYDSQGMDILYDRVDIRDEDTILNDRVAIYHDSEASFPESAMWGIIASKTGRTEYSLGPNYFGSRVSPLGPAISPLVDLAPPYPQLTTGEITFPFQATAEQRIESPNFRFEGTATFISQVLFEPDTDEDGVVDRLDSCPMSIMDETVLFDGWYDSGVPNYVDDSGCSIMDYYAVCEAEEQEAPVRGIRSVRSGPSSCEKAVSYDLVADGVISYAEARALREALYESSSSSGLR